MNTKFKHYRTLSPDEKKRLAQRNEEIYKKRLEGQTFDSIAQEYGISRERVRQVHAHLNHRYERSKT
jgi:DNA-directed RNA polymerase sigma subunit (sigma70/sigma32)